MHTIIIDAELRDLLPPLSPESFAALEASLLEHGVRDALVVWKGHNILVDGHNRHEIATRHKLSYKVIEMEFDSREEVLIFIVSNQISRRNLPPLQFSYFVGLHYRSIKLIVGRPSLDDRENKYHQNDDISASARKRLAKKYKISASTIDRAAKISEGIDAIAQVSPNAKKMIIAGDVRISKKKLTALAAAPKKEVKELAKSIENGSYTAHKPALPLPDSDSNAPSKPGGSASGTTQSPQGLKELEAQISAIRESFDRDLKILANKDSTAIAAKPLLKSYLDKLETLHNSILKA
ncbi:MAG: hypothetical protein FWD27_09070 [Coriobacteriia bacterium]|nr:hypothetical protein [Coriobacteriia bacterium]